MELQGTDCNITLCKFDQNQHYGQTILEQLYMHVEV